MNVKRSILLIFFICIIIYSNSLGGEFAYDDEYFVVKNINIRNLENIPSFFINPSTVAFAKLSEDVYRPITTLSYALDYFFWRLDTFGYHLINVLFHSSSATVLFLFLYVAFGNISVALLASLLFACHPVQTEVVSWISGRASVLFLFFYLSALIFYVRFLKESKKIYFVYSLTFYALSLFSKEMAVTLPLVLITHDIHFPIKERIRNKIYRYAPFCLLTIFFVLMRYLVLKRVSQCSWWGGSPYHTFLTMSRVLIEYIKLLFLPFKLCAFYFIDISKSIAEARVLGSLAILILLAITLPFIFRRSRKLSFSIWWFFITLLPVSNIIPLKALMAERFLYLPSIGFCVGLAIFIDRIRGIKTKAFSKIGLSLAILTATALIISYSLRTMVRNEDWKDAIAISKSIIKISPLNPWGYTSLGTAYLGREQYEAALKALKKAVSLSADYASPKNALGFCYLQMKRYEDAVEMLKEAARLEPDNLETLNSLGVAYGSMKKYDEARKKFEASIKIDPTFVSAYLNLGTVYEQKKEYEKALEQYKRIEANINSRQEIAISYIRMGDVYIKMKLKDRAKECYNKAIVFSCDRGLEELKKVAMERLNRLK